MRLRVGVIGLALLLASAAAAPAAQARDAIVESFDGTPIVTHFFPAQGPQAGKRAPTLLIGPGWSSPGESNPEAGSVGAFVDEGYNVVTWDPRGFGGSGGTVMIDHPEYEGRDVQALIDFIAEQPEAELDGPGDPRLGMSGGSYGGGIQLVTAGIDDRVDVIAPTISWNSLVTSLFRADKVKIGWGLALAGIGLPQSIAGGVFSPAGAQTGSQSPEFFSTVTEGAATGTISEANRQWFAEHGPDFLLSKIKVPTLLIQGTVDTLFTLDEADANFRGLKRQGVPLKMVFFCGGHGVCMTESDSASALFGDSALAQKRRLQWFDRYLREKRNVETGPTFEWIDEEGAFHTSERYPPRTTDTISGAGSGTLPLTPGVSPPPGSGLALFGTPQDVAVKAPLDTPAGLEIVGKPQLELTYSGTAAPAQTHVFAQLVDRARNVVVGNQVTPIPVTLDGQEHSLTAPLEGVASLSAEPGYELQLVAASTVYDIQRSAGAVEVKQARVELPVTQGHATPADDCLSYPFGTKAGDRLQGSDGRDCLRGRSGDDRIASFDGDDTVNGGRGKDRIKAGDGADLIRAARGARDRIDCGPGRDRAIVHPRRDRWRGCERVVKRG